MPLPPRDNKTRLALVTLMKTHRPISFLRFRDPKFDRVLLAKPPRACVRATPRAVVGIVADFATHKFEKAL